MSLYRTPRSPYWQYDFTWKGHRAYGSTGCTDRREAERFEARERHKLIERVETGGAPKRLPITLDEAAGIYIAHIAEKPSAPEAERMLLAMLDLLGKHRLLSEIRQSELLAATHKRRAGRVNSSVNREIEVWRAMWRWADRNRYHVGEMPDWGALFLDVKAKPPRELATSEESALFANLREDLHAFARFALMSGWRLSEVIRLRWSDVKPDAMQALTVVKGGETVARPLTRAMLAHINAQPRVGAHVFTYVCQKSRTTHEAKDGRKRTARRVGERYPLSAGGWRKAWTAALAKAGIDALRFHDLRHTRATRIVRATGDLAAAKRALAHKSIKTTLRYAHAMDDDVRRALEMSETGAQSRTITEAPKDAAEKAS